MYISLVHKESTTAFWWENPMAWERGTQRLLAGKTQQLSREKHNNFQREKHNYWQENTTIGWKNTTIGGKNTTIGGKNTTIGGKNTKTIGGNFFTEILTPQAVAADWERAIWVPPFYNF